MKVELKVQDLLQKAANDKFYIALLRERDGNRSLPILVGLLEAQAIAMFLRDIDGTALMQGDGDGIGGACIHIDGLPILLAYEV